MLVTPTCRLIATRVCKSWRRTGRKFMICGPGIRQAFYKSATRSLVGLTIGTQLPLPSPTRNTSCYRKRRSKLMFLHHPRPLLLQAARGAGLRTSRLSLWPQPLFGRKEARGENCKQTSISAKPKRGFTSREKCHAIPLIRLQQPLRTAQRAERRRWLTDPLWLRDTCKCPRCVDQSTSQKLFQTSDLPLDVEAVVLRETDSAIDVAWENDLPSSGTDHVSTFQKDSLSSHLPSERAVQEPPARAELWDKAIMEKNIRFIDFTSFQASEATVYAALAQLKTYGLVFIKGAPTSEPTIEAIATRIGHLRETFYGRTWDVRSVAEAKNVAYTDQYLGFHMDLLYMSDPPGLQLLHCLKNSCLGGSSMFSDAFKAANMLEEGELDVLEEYPQTFHYDNAGEHYLFRRPAISRDSSGDVEFVNWSPPFQGVFDTGNCGNVPFSDYVKAAKSFSRHAEAAKNIYEYRMQEGDCAIFNNRRVLHARRAFDSASGERWLKGAYLDTDVFNSRWRVLHGKMRAKKDRGSSEH